MLVAVGQLGQLGLGAGEIIAVPPEDALGVADDHLFRIDPAGDEHLGHRHAGGTRAADRHLEVAELAGE